MGTFKRGAIYTLFAVLSCAATLARADTINFKNGGSITGIVEREDGNTIEVSMGFGTVTFNKSQVKTIERSSSEESRQMAEAWEEKRIELKNRKEEFDRSRDKRSRDAYDYWMEDIRRKKSKEEGAAKQIKITRDPDTRAIIIRALLDDSVNVNLMLDTGASLIMLSRKIGEALGVDLSDVKKDVMELHLADGRRTAARAVILKSVRIQDVEVKNVMAAIMLDQIPEPGLVDGLLGMSFLSKFNLKMDLKGMSMTLEKIE
jgi:aspartyl protease family protein